MSIFISRLNDFEMPSSLMIRRAICSTLRSARGRSASCHPRLTANASNSRSANALLLIGPSNFKCTSICFYSTQNNGRQWKTVNQPSNSSNTSFTLMSYNILAQHHVDSQPSLYHKHASDSLRWSHRFDVLSCEINSISPDILCLQEVQQNHLAQIAAHFDGLGYDTSLFKKRTGLQVDGCAIFFKKSLFDLIEFHFVDYFQPDIKVCVDQYGGKFVDFIFVHFLILLNFASNFVLFFGFSFFV